MNDWLNNTEQKMSDLKEKEESLRGNFSEKQLRERFEDAIKVIEEIAVHQEELPEHLNTEKEKQLHKAITQIYKIAHTARLPGCFNKHLSWEEQFHKLKEQL